MKNAAELPQKVEIQMASIEERYRKALETYAALRSKSNRGDKLAQYDKHKAHEEVRAIEREGAREGKVLGYAVTEKGGTAVINGGRPLQVNGATGEVTLREIRVFKTPTKKHLQGIALDKADNEKELEYKDRKTGEMRKMTERQNLAQTMGLPENS